MPSGSKTMQSIILDQCSHLVLKNIHLWVHSLSDAWWNGLWEDVSSEPQHNLWSIACTGFSFRPKLCKAEILLWRRLLEREHLLGFKFDSWMLKCSVCWTNTFDAWFNITLDWMRLINQVSWSRFIGLIWSLCRNFKTWYVCCVNIYIYIYINVPIFNKAWTGKIWFGITLQAGVCRSHQNCIVLSLTYTFKAFELVFNMLINRKQQFTLNHVVKLQTQNN